MSRKMLINVLHPEEARVAIVSDGKLMDLNIEISGKEQTKGNIYKGIVMRVEPSLQAAFVDIGLSKPGFIQMGDIHPSTWQWRDDLPEEERPKRPRIQDILRRGQELMLQVEKDARDMKGAALTGYISMPGRYMVLMPGDSAAGISRKIEEAGTRKELKAQVADLGVPEGYGYIIRTEAAGHSTDELRADLDYLVGVHKQIQQSYNEKNGAGRIYQDAGVIIRSLRDYFSDDIDEILVDDVEAYQQAVSFLKQIAPGMEKRVKQHREKRPIFSKFQLEEQIDHLYEKRVPLPSGGSLIIEPTEALVSIDVNSGKTSGERGVEDTAFKTNMEAAVEVARQLRLRDLGGLVVIDFIDMRDHRHNKDVEHALKDALKADKARVNIGKISQFGMLEMSRQRIAKNIHDAIHLECPHCEGRGRVKSVEAMALSFLRKVHAAAAKGQLAEVRGGLPLEVAYYLLNRKKRDLAQIENDYDIVVTVKGKPSFLLNQLDLEVVKKEKQREETAPLQQLASAVTPSETNVSPPLGDDQAEVQAASATKRKRKRKRKKKVEDSATPELLSSEMHDSELEQPSEAPDTGATEDVVDTPIEGEPQEGVDKKKRSRRSRSRKKPEIEFAIVVADAEPLDAAESEHVESAAVPEKKTRSRRKSASKKKALPLTDGPAQEIVAPALADTAIAETTDVTKPVRKRAPRKKKAEAVALADGVTPVMPVESEEAPLPQSGARRGRKTTKVKENSN